MIFTELTDIKKFCSRFFLLIRFLFTGFSFLAMGNGLRTCPERVRRRSGEGGVGGELSNFLFRFHKHVGKIYRVCVLQSTEKENP
jgi:hypothetical protein